MVIESIRILYNDVLIIVGVFIILNDFQQFFFYNLSDSMFLFITTVRQH